jgi:molybdopterin converting factor small subunit
MAELKFLGYLADKIGKRSQEVLLEKPQRLRDLLPSPFPEQDIVILINQKVGNLDSMIKDEDRVVLMPMISGG